MAILQSASDGLFSGVIGLVGAIVLSVVRDRVKKKSFDTAWQAQAKELLRESRRATEGERAWFRAELERRDNTNAVALAQCQGEVQRLNRLLNKERGND